VSAFKGFWVSVDEREIRIVADRLAASRPASTAPLVWRRRAVFT
jgi:hypothetical protein